MALRLVQHLIVSFKKAVDWDEDNLANYRSDDGNLEAHPMTMIQIEEEFRKQFPHANIVWENYDRCRIEIIWSKTLCIEATDLFNDIDQFRD